MPAVPVNTGDGNLFTLLSQLRMRDLTVVESPTYVTVVADEVMLTIEARPTYCDRGRWIVNAWPSGKFALEFDEMDGFPRYYFWPDALARELDTWLRVRGRV